MQVAVITITYDDKNDDGFGIEAFREYVKSLEVIVLNTPYDIEVKIEGE